MAGTQSDTDRMSQTWVYRWSALTGVDMATVVVGEGKKEGKIRKYALKEKEN